MKKTFLKKAISIMLAVVMSVTATLPAVSAFAGDGVEGKYDLQIFFSDTDTIVPSYQEDGKTEYVVYMTEGDELQFKYKMIDSMFPDNGYVKWYSEAPALADVDQTGKVKAFDSSKGAVIHLWIDNEVKTIPLLGAPLAAILEKAFFNEYVDIDSMDTDEIVGILEKALGSNSWIAEQIESYKGELIDSLRTYLDKVNSNVHCVLYDKYGEKQADDVIRIVVKKNEEWYAAFLPNGTHITNKSQVPDTVAKGGQVQLYAITTPQRLNFGTVYSVKSSSIASQGKVVATVDDSGLVKFKNIGTATIMVSPDSDDVIQGLLKFINYFYKLQHTGTIDSKKAADIIIKYIGLDINRNVLAAILDACFAISDIVGDAADPVQLTATAVKLIANLCLQFVYNDTIDFTVVKSKPIEKFEIDGLKTVKEGQQIQLSPTNVVPTVGDISDIVWTSEDPSIACVDKETGVVTGLDAGGSLGSLSSKTVKIHATSTTNNVDRSMEITVTGKTGKYLSKVDIKGKSLVGIEETENFTYTVYPKRVAESDNLYIKWGMVGPEDEDGNPTYIWAEGDAEAVDANNVGKIDSKGHFTPLNGGKCKIALEAKTGYRISDGSFYEISSYTAVKEVETGIPVEKIDIKVTKPLGLGASLGRNETVNINGKDYYYCTEKIGVGTAYNGVGTAVSADVYPENATFKDIKWVVSNGNYEQKISEDTHTNEITIKAANEYAQKYDVYAVSSDGQVKSNVITVCVTRNYATGNDINEKTIDLINGKTGEATHTMTFSGSWDSSGYACYDANWYSSDEEIFTVENKGNDNSDAVLTAHDVGTAKLYCVSADGAFRAERTVTVRPDKQTLRELVNLCERTVVYKTNFNKKYYKDYCRKLNLAYIVLDEEEMASQNVVDTTAANLLAAFTKIGGFVSITDVQITGTHGVALDSNYVTVQVGTAKNYKNYSYDFDYKINPKGAMYSKVKWSSSNSSVSVDENGICRPTSNEACAADITCSITDYSGTQVIDVVHIAFAKKKATDVEIKPNEITEAKIGETQKLEAVVHPKSVIGKSEASVGAVTWSSTNEKVCTVDENGVVSFLYGGNARIVATTADGGFKAECKVTVTTNYDNLALLLNQIDSLALREESFYPETWQPFITAKQEAEEMLANKNSTQEEVDAQCAKLKEAQDNLKKYVDIKKVELYLDGEQTKEFYQYDLNLLTGGWNYTNAKLNLKIRLYPNNATYQKAEWISSTTDISVSSDGVCSPTSNKPCYGEIKCVVTDSFGKEFYDTVWVSYSKNPVTGIELNTYNVAGAIGSTYVLKANILPDGKSLSHLQKADIRDYYWESDDENVATIDQDGTVHFVSAGSTVVRCVSYDGGIYAECKVSTEGDRTALKEAIQEYESVDYTQYEYEYGMAFKNAYDEAINVLNDKTMSQKAIDDATSALKTAGEALAEHPYIFVDSITVNYETKARKLASSSARTVASGTIGSNSALSVDLSKAYESSNNRNDVVLTAKCNPENAMYKSVTWEILERSHMDSKLSSGTFTLTPSSATTAVAWARVKAVFTNDYGKTTEREIWITMGDVVCTGLSVQPESLLELKGTSEPQKITATTTGTGTGYLNKIVFSSTNEEVATVSENGVVTPVNAGDCNIIVKTFDGGITKIIPVHIETDYSELAAKVTEYEDLINKVKDTNQYTASSLDALSEQVKICKEMINANKSTQQEVNAALRKLNEAYGNLSGYKPATGIKIWLNDSQSEIKEVNPGFIRYQSTSLNGVGINLNSKISPDDGMYSSITWSSSNDSITVSNEGYVTNTSALPGSAKITATVKTDYGDTYSDSVYVSFVRNAVKGLSFETTLLYGAPNKQKQITPIIESDSKISEIHASVTTCLYESMDEKVATVNADGLVTFKSQGKTTIKVTTVDGGYVGEVQVQTTWDTSALEEAIIQARALNYQDYEYKYGTRLQEDLANAEAVFGNPDATQKEIDAACTKLQTTVSELESHKFVLPVVTMTVNGEAIANGMSYETVDNKLTIDVAIKGNMYKTFELTTSNETNVTSAIGEGKQNIVLTKTGDSASVTVNARVVDDYDRETTYTYNIQLVNKIVPIKSIYITLDGQKVDSVTKSGYSFGYRDFAPFTLSYGTDEVGYTEPTAVKWESNNSDYITISNDGVVNLTTKAKFMQSVETKIICTVTNANGEEVTTRIPVVIKLK